MDHNKVCRMSQLFEKMVSDNANHREQCELKSLYEEFIEDGRDDRRLVKQQSRRQQSNKRITH